MSPSPLGGAHYPRSLGEFQAWFSTDADCLDYPEWLRWPEGFVCPECCHPRAWELADGRYECRECHERTSVTAGTIFDRTRTPLTVWFTACWLFATQKDGISALSLKRAPEIGSYQTAWAMLHRVRSVLVRPGRERLEGVVEADESYFGGEEPGLSGGRAKGKKVLVGVAVERVEPKGFGRCRMVPLPDASGDSLRAFLLDNVREGAKGDHRRLEVLPAGDPRSVRPRAARGRVRGGRLEPASWCAHRRLAGEALAAGHPSGAARRRSPGQLSQRVRVPLRPPPLAQPRARLLPRPGARRRARTDPLPRPDPQSREAHRQAAPAADKPRQARQPRSTPSQPAVAGGHTALLR